jgi:hypothetical protein
VFSSQLAAQLPQKFNYQAVCRDNAGNIIANQSATLRMTIHDLTAGGAVVYQETHAVTTNSFGLVNVAVGAGTPFQNIAWGVGDKYLQIELNTGSGFNDFGTQQLLSVPYALYAGNTAPGSLHKKVYKGIIDTAANGDHIKIDSAGSTFGSPVKQFHYKTILIPEIQVDSLPLLTLYMKPKFNSDWAFPVQSASYWVFDNNYPQMASPDYLHAFIIDNGAIHVFYKVTLYYLANPTVIYTLCRVTGEYQIVVVH